MLVTILGQIRVSRIDTYERAVVFSRQMLAFASNGRHRMTGANLQNDHIVVFFDLWHKLLVFLMLIILCEQYTT